MRTLHFWNWWSIEHQDNARIAQGRPQWCAEATYEDPTFDYIGFWPRVWKDDDAGRMERLLETFGGTQGIVEFGVGARPRKDALRILEVPRELIAKGDRHLAAHPDPASCPVRGIGKAAYSRAPSEYRLSTLFRYSEKNKSPSRPI